MGVRRRAGVGLMLLAAGVMLGGCTQEMAVALTIMADPSLDDTTLAVLRRLDIRVTGVEGACVSYQLPEGFARSREERVIYRARARSGDLAFAVTVRDGVEGAQGYGTVGVTLEPNRVQFARVVVRSPVPTGADEPCIVQPPDLGELRDLPAPPGDQSQLNCDDGNPCTVDEVVQGSGGSTCRNTPGNRGAVCRVAAGICDVAESCDGVSSACPADGFASTSTECRPVGGACDVAEYCDGASAGCPADGFSSTDVQCRGSNGPCDVAENCTGTSAACPADVFRASDVICRESAGICDVAESCTGSSAACPTDVFAGRGGVCRPVSGDCDVAESCTGRSASCPVDSFLPPSTVCRSIAGPCDIAESCTGTSAVCPADGVQPQGTICRASTAICDPAEVCSGSSISCPSDTSACIPPTYFWLRADAGVTVSGGSVPLWQDQSGSRHARQASYSQPPTFISGALNGMPVIRFDGSQSLALDAAISPVRFTVFVVGKNNLPTEDYSIILGPGPASYDNNQLRWENGTEVLVVGLGNNLPIITSTVGNTRVYHTLSVRYDGGTLSIYRDGAVSYSTAVSTSGPWNLAQVGAWTDRYYMRGDLAEIIVYDRALSASEQQSVLSYLRSKYALP